MATFPVALRNSSKVKPPVEEPKKNSPIPSFMATFHQWTNLCQSTRATVAGASCRWPVSACSKNNSPIRRFMANLPTRCSRQRQDGRRFNIHGALMHGPGLGRRLWGETASYAHGRARWAFNPERSCLRSIDELNYFPGVTESTVTLSALSFPFTATFCPAYL
jgi:hypothetical protein